LSSAEQQEVIEVLLAYRFLLAAPEGLIASELDARIEAWLRATCSRDIDFEIDDAIAKLRQLELIEGSRKLRSRPLVDSLVMLDRRWDDLFQYTPAAAIPIANGSHWSRCLEPLRKVVVAALRRRFVRLIPAILRKR
jgi:hypothetical protein